MRAVLRATLLAMGLATALAVRVPAAGSRRSVLKHCAGGLLLLAPLQKLPAAHAAERTGLQSRWLEKVRIVLQDEADAVMYGGELAPGGPPPAFPVLMLIPIVNLVIYILICNGIAKSFGRGVGTAIGLFFLPMIFMPILGFGSAQYEGKATGFE